MQTEQPAGAGPVLSEGLGLSPEWLAGAYTQAWRADVVRSWPAENAARYTVPLFTAEQVRAAVAAERERCAQIVETRRQAWPFDWLEGMVEQAYLRQWLAAEIRGPNVGVDRRA